jgi:hypothetical protein
MDVSVPVCDATELVDVGGETFTQRESLTTILLQVLDIQGLSD